MAIGAIDGFAGMRGVGNTKLLRMCSLVGVLSLAACATAPSVKTTVGSDVAFTTYRTFAWRTEPATQSPLVRQRIVSAVDSALLSRGWREASAWEADLLIVAHVTSRREETLETIYESPNWQGWRWSDVHHVGDARSLQRIDYYTIGTLIIDLFDARTRQVVWRASAEGMVPDSPDKINATIDATVPRMFAKLPPR